MSENRCPMCGEGVLQSRREAQRYGRGVEVVLLNVAVRHCPACGEELLVIPAIEALHKAIAASLAKSAARLRPGGIPSSVPTSATRAQTSRASWE